MPNGGYVKENGISVCDGCHLKAEEFHSTGTAVEGFAPEALYEKIGSSYEEAYAASEALAPTDERKPDPEARAPMNVECSKCGRVYCDCDSKY